METDVYRSDDHALLDRLVTRFQPVPFRNEKGERIGTVLSVRRDGSKLIAKIECAPAGMEAAQKRAAERESQFWQRFLGE